MGPCLLVGDQCSVVLTVSCTGFPAGLPIHIVTAPEQQVNTGIACFFDIVTLVAGPVFIMADRDKRSVLLEVIRAKPVSIDTRDVSNVVAVLLQPRDRRIIRPEQIVLRTCSRSTFLTFNTAGYQRPVVADRISAVLGKATGTGDIRMVNNAACIAIKIRADLTIVVNPAVVGVPGCVGCL